MSKTGKRTDENHAAVIAGLRAVGAFCQSLASVGRGCPDILVSFRNVWYVAEIKDGEKSPSRQALTEAEKYWHASATAPVHIWTSLDDALQAIGATLQD